MRASILPLLMCLTPVHAGNLPGAVFEYECKQINPAETGFKCLIEDGIMRIHFDADTKNMSKEEKEYANYRYNALLIRYFDLGGKQFRRTSEQWPKGTTEYCVPSKGKRYSFICDKE